MNANIEEILQRQMDRKDFLKHVAAGVAAVSGVGMVVRALQPQATPQANSSMSNNYSYGSSPYGGYLTTNASLTSPRR